MDTMDQVEALLQVCGALALGGLIGAEREYRGFEAGIRTSALVSAGAALFVIGGNQYDESRVAAAVVQGIGFLGAGLIFHRGTTVHNLTTATTIWVGAGIGMAVAMSLWVLAVAVTAAVIVLLELAPLSDWVHRHGDNKAPGTAARQEEEMALGPRPDG